jgi:eukaryotic-like serine/threonine-protein kinase
MMTNNTSVLLASQQQTEFLPTILRARYQIIDVLGQGGVGITYRATDLTNNGIVVVKALSLRRAHDWKAIELFEREAKVLSQLNHPAIPRYIDYFQVDNENDRQFYIIQTLAPGESLAALIEKGWKPTVEEVQDIAAQILEILIYLHTLIPAVIHRDIKPQNIIRSADGQISLVDFGSVQDTYHHTITGGSTVVGTYGYMAPEQFRGQAYFSTDLYGLGAMLLYLLTGKDPSTLPQRKLKIDFSNEISVPQKFANWLDRLLEPDIQRRFETANQALAVLDGDQELPILAGEKPANSRINLAKSTTSLQIDIPAFGLSSRNAWIFSLITFAWNGLLLLMLFYSMTIKSELDPTKQLFLLPYGIIGLSGFVKCYYWLRSTATINLQSDSIIYVKNLGKSEYWRREFPLISNSWRQEFVGTHGFLSIFQNRIEKLITKEERRWLLSEIDAFIDRDCKK